VASLQAWAQDTLSLPNKPGADAIENKQTKADGENGYRPPPLDYFSAVVERPLFSETRRPNVIIPRKAAAPVKRPVKETKRKATFFLAGVIYDGDEYVALLKTSRNGELQKVAKGGSISGWEVEDIQPEAVRVRNGINYSVVSLRDNKLSESERRKMQKDTQRKQRMKNLKKRKATKRTTKKRATPPRRIITRN